MEILVTGGTGYIGSHTVVELINKNYEVVILDNLSNSSIDVVGQIEAITGTKVPFYNLDCRDRDGLTDLFQKEHFDGVIHFAGLKAVGESVEKPLMYYQNNIDSTLILCNVMNNFSVKNLIFSSSATVYGNIDQSPLTETSQTGQGITNPYGQTKYMLETILKDIAKADPKWRISLLRYFNPIGAHDSGLIGEQPNGIPNNLMPYISKVATGELTRLLVYGDDYDTKDGTGVRDYIHVVDLAKGHLKSLEHLGDQTSPVEIYNLGTGNGTTVMELLNAFERVSGLEIPYKIVERRSGDIAACYADATKAKLELGWSATKTINDMCADTWRWIQSSDKEVKL